LLKLFPNQKYTALKKSTLLFIILVGLSGVAMAQQKRQINGQHSVDKCGTMKFLEEFYRENPEIKQINEQLVREAENPNSSMNRYNNSNRVQAIVTIPIVFHIVLPNPYVVTNADIQAQVDRLNLDYSGLNADSTNIPPQFQAVRGHSQIRFCLAQKTPTGLSTNGIERRASATLYNASNNDPIKAAAGGLVAWDFTRYFNIWVGTGGGLLGYATFPGSGNASQQGVVTDIIGTAANPCYVDPQYNMGRTLTHEAGHYFGLYHIWGDEAACATSDFRNIGGTCVIPTATGLAGANADQTTGDTPNQASETYGCFTGVQTDACATTAPGKMYQNYMDYTDDACMTMFTQKQAERMEWVVNNCRSGYLTSDGCIPPLTGNSLDAAPIYVVNPGGIESFPDCSTVSYTSNPCPGPFVPKVRITNNGLNIMNSVTVGYILDANPAVTLVSNTALSSNQTTVITFPVISVTTGGTHTIKYFTSNPNGAADPVGTNDTVTAAFNVTLPVAANIAEGFEAATFPPVGWKIFNPDGSTTWARSANNRGANGTVRSAWVDVYNYAANNTVDVLASPSVILTGQDSLRVSFYVAHAGYTVAGFGPDTLQLMYSSDCGVTWRPFGNYKKWTNGTGANALNTSANTANAYNPGTTATNWRQEKVNVPLPLPGNPTDIMIGWRSSTNYGNNIYVDQINIDRFQFATIGNDIGLTAIVKPLSQECASTIIPSVSIKNYGLVPVTQFKVGYSLDNGPNVITTFNQTIAPITTVTVNLPAISPAAGNHTIKIFTAEPVTASGTGDPNLLNDTLVRAFSLPLIAANVIEGFEGNVFVPTNWLLINPNSDLTWEKVSPGKSSLSSAFIDNFSTNTTGQLDLLRPPAFSTAGADSVIISFDVAHKNYPASFDRLRVLVSADCGATYTSVYSKSGTVLATAGESDEDFRDPAQSEWRNERISLNSSFTASGALYVQFENLSDWGNNIFLDNINIQPIFKRDIEVVAVSPSAICSPAFTPVATIHNRGTETVTAFKVSYAIGNGTAVTTTVTGVSLSPNATTSVTLTAGTLAAGANNVKVYASEPVTVSGTGDQYLLNDTITKTSYIVSSVQAPASVVETFEGTYLPAGWALSNPDNSFTWQKAIVGKNSTGSAFIRNFIYSNRQKDELYTPQLRFTAVDSVKVSFDVSATTRDLGSPATGMDTLEVLVSKDCGTTFTSVYKKWGSSLQSLYVQNYAQPTEFTPMSFLLWRTETIDLTSYAPAGSLQVMFRNTANGQNNIYIDNVNFKTVVLPTRLKAEGVIVTPNPFGNQFNLWFVQTPADLRYITVLNAAGQLIWNKVYSSGSTSNVINVDLSGKAAGIYVINLGYSDKGKDKQIRVLKTN
jgi:Pregnancy-associated plasma protein-A